jgi:hypothetical protein
VKLTVDCLLDHQTMTLSKHSALSSLLAMGKSKTLDQTLEALLCDQYAVPLVGDYPIAAIAAAADGLDVAKAYWLRADPVHLRLQRDCFSLDESVPLPILSVHAEQMLESLNQHFALDLNADSGKPEYQFFIGTSGAWYLRCQQHPSITTTLPSVAAGKNSHQFLPQGTGSAKLIGLLNEVQMLLHEHPGNLAREAQGLEAVNSVWLSGGGFMPTLRGSANAELLMANSALYQGLALWTNADYQFLPTHMDEVLTNRAVRMQLVSSEDLDALWFKQILAALCAKKITQLTLNLGYYDLSLSVNIKPIDQYKFWSKANPVQHYLS